MFNLPPSIFNYQGMMGKQAGPKWSTTNPFRTVESPAAYGDGLNSSASQMYQHILRQKGHPYLAENGWTPAHNIQSQEDFANRHNPTPMPNPGAPNIPPPKAPGDVPNPNMGNFQFGNINFPSIFNVPGNIGTPLPPAPGGQPGMPVTEPPTLRPQITGQMKNPADAMNFGLMGSRRF
jgi:hypothetical protein